MYFFYASSQNALCIIKPAPPAASVTSSFAAT